MFVANLQISSPTSPTRNLDRLYICLVVRLFDCLFGWLVGRRMQRFSRLQVSKTKDWNLAVQTLGLQPGSAGREVSRVIRLSLGTSLG